MATLIKSNDEGTEIKPKVGKYFSLEEMQELVGGFIEMLSIANGRKMIVNEEGKQKGLPINPRASQLYGRDTIVGDVLICQAENGELF